MTIRRAVRLVCVTAVAIAAGGCASVTLAPDDLDAQAKRFRPQAGKANVYLTRTSPLGGAFLFQVFLDGKLAGSIAPNTYLLFEVEPGERRLAVTTPESQFVAGLTAAASESYFIEVMPVLGMMNPRAELVALAPEEGRKAVLDTKRAADLLNAASQPRTDLTRPEVKRQEPVQEGIRFRSQGAGTEDKGVVRGYECLSRFCPDTR